MPARREAHWVIGLPFGGKAALAAALAEAWGAACLPDLFAHPTVISARGLWCSPERIAMARAYYSGDADRDPARMADLVARVIARYRWERGLRRVVVSASCLVSARLSSVATIAAMQSHSFAVVARNPLDVLWLLQNCRGLAHGARPSPRNAWHSAAVRSMADAWSAHPPRVMHHDLIRSDRVGALRAAACECGLRDDEAAAALFCLLARERAGTERRLQSRTPLPDECLEAVLADPKIAWMMSAMGWPVSKEMYIDPAHAQPARPAQRDADRHAAHV